MKILVTGGSSGLGRAIVEKLASKIENEILFTYCRNLKAVEELNSSFPNTKGYCVDFTDCQSINDFIEQLENIEIDVLVNNAYSGSAQGKRFHQTEFEDFLKAFNDNILPTVRITQACIKGMRKRKFGKIVNIITSYVMDVPPIGFSVYATTKAYLRQLSKSISREYASFNITSNCILPDYMPTTFGQVSDYQLEQMLATHPLKQLLTPSEAADIVIGVIEASQQLNGVEIPINAAQHIL